MSKRGFCAGMWKDASPFLSEAFSFTRLPSLCPFKICLGLLRDCSGPYLPAGGISAQRAASADRDGFKRKKLLGRIAYLQGASAPVRMQHHRMGSLNMSCRRAVLYRGARLGKRMASRRPSPAGDLRPAGHHPGSGRPCCCLLIAPAGDAGGG